MMISDVEKLIKVFEHANITSMELELDNLKLKLTKTENQVVNNVEQATTPEEDNNQVESGFVVKSPLVGSYHEAPFVGAQPFVHVGQTVNKGDKLCIIEAMKVMNEITSPVDGVVTKILLQEGAMVEYDQDLFVIGDSNV